jgi:iron complex transport system substrate-binding protein
VDHSGERLTLGRYTRIASLSVVADEILREVCEPDRVVAVTGYSARSANGYRFAGKPLLEGEGDLERILALRPDLVLVNRIGDARPLARMREAGLKVYDLGEMRGMATLVPNIREVAALVGHPERGDAFAQSWTNRMRTIAADLPPARRKRGLYLGVEGGHLYGGALGTSYHDAVTAGGLVDAAEPYRDWPEYSAEQLLALDPEVIVTSEGMRPRICEHAGLSSLRACGDHGVVAELDGSLLADPGLSMADAANAVRQAVYGPPL